MKGRWQLQRHDNPGAGCFTVAWGEFPHAGQKIDVVPCDDAAVERAARALCNGDHGRHAPDCCPALPVYRRMAQDMFRAAGRTS